MKSLSSVLYLYKDEYFFLRQFFEECFNELTRKKNENKTQYCKRLKNIYPIAFENVVKRNREVEILENLKNSLARLFPMIFPGFYTCDIDIDCKNYEKLFENNFLSRLKIELYRVNETEYYSSFSDYLFVEGAVLLRKIIEKKISENSGNNEVSKRKELLERFSQFFKITVDCPYGVYLKIYCIKQVEIISIEEPQIIPCEDKIASFFIDKPKALCSLGLMYYYGDFVEQDYLKAFSCFELAAEKGIEYARKCLSVMYYYGEGVEKNYLKAKELYYKVTRDDELLKLLKKIFPDHLGENDLENAVDKNDTEAQIRVGDFFCERGRKQDYLKAYEWYIKAAEQGNSEAQNKLGIMYVSGKGVQQDYSKAYEWYIKAANQGNSNAKCNLGLLYKNKNFIHHDYLKAKEWLESAANADNSFSQNCIANMYLDGEGVEKNYKIALEWAEKTVKCHDKKSINFLLFIKNLMIPIMAAAKDNSVDIAKKLIDSGIDVNMTYKQEMTALMVAAQFNSVDVAKLLIANGAEIDAANEEGKTALVFVAQYNSLDVAKLLIKKGANINAELCPFGKLTILSLAVKNKSIDIVKLLVEKDEKIKNEALIFAAKYNSAKIAEFLIETGANMTGALTEAVKANSLAVLKLLIEAGAYCGKTALKTAISRGYVHIAKILLDAGADEITDAGCVNTLNNNEHWKKSNIQFEFHPKDENVFKRLFILVGEAHRFFYLKNIDEPVLNVWHIRSFSMDSNLKACIFASTCYREYMMKGLYKVKLEIPGCQKYENYSLEQVNQNINDIKQHILEELSNQK